MHWPELPLILMKNKSFFNSFFKGELSYCPLIWTFCSERSNKVLHGLSPPIMSKIFTKKDCPYSLRNPRSLITNCKSTVKYGIDSIVYLQTLPTDLRNSESSIMFKCNIKNLRDINWQCEICKIYIRNVGYVAWRQQKVIGLHIYKICNIKYIYVYVYL